MTFFNSASEVSQPVFQSVVWGIPFVGILLSIALLPLCAPSFWHRHYGKVAAFWTAMFILPYAAVYGIGVAGHTVFHTLIAEYFPFIILLTALYTVAGGLCVRGRLHGTPAVNTVLLALGTGLASVLGTTGASILLIRPLLRANEHRQYCTHVVIFFIFLVANIGGALTPLGDPPLFLGFLNGVSFFWTTAHLIKPMLFVTGLLLVLFYALDRYYFHQREHTVPLTVDPKLEVHRIWIEGKVNFILLGALLGAVLMSGVWRSAKVVNVLGIPVELQNLVRDGLLILITLISLRVTPASARLGNAFNWEPIQEVAKLFAGIFVTIAPVIALVHAGESGPLGFIVRAVTDTQGNPIDAGYFWMTGILSSFLDNAPTYLIFFNTAGGDAAHLMGSGATTLIAISAGAVFMGANTYIGNAPNFMIRSIAQAKGVKMPSFLGYMVWSGSVLIPIFILTTLLFFRTP